MKILQVIQFFSPEHGGSPLAPYYLSRELSKRGHEVTIFTSDYKLSRKWIESLHPVKVHPFKTSLTWANFYATPGMIENAKEEIKYFDLIHMHNYRTFQNIVIAHYANKYSVPYVLQAHGSLPRIMAKQRLKWIYDVFFGYRVLRDASKVIALSRVEAEQYRGMGVLDEKIAIIPNGIDLSEYANLPSKGAFKKKFNIPCDKKIILYLGRIHRTKGIDFLVKAYAYLTKNMKCNDTVLVIAGPDDGYLGEAKQLVTRLKITDKVVFTGMLSEKEKISVYVDSTICTYLRRYEPFGLVPLEAAACRTPVIVSSGTYMGNIVNERKFGFSVKYGDVNKLAEIMGKMLTNEDLLREMGQIGREYVFENCDWAHIITKLEKVYRETVQ